jgi:uncharacterized membrane protein YgcG
MEDSTMVRTSTNLLWSLRFMLVMALYVLSGCDSARVVEPAAAPEILKPSFNVDESGDWVTVATEANAPREYVKVFSDITGIAYILHQIDLVINNSPYPTVSDDVIDSSHTTSITVNLNCNTYNTVRASSTHQATYLNGRIFATSGNSSECGRVNGGGGDGGGGDDGGGDDGGGDGGGGSDICEAYQLDPGCYDVYVDGEYAGQICC